MASNLTDQVRGIVKVVTAVANGNLSQRLTVQAKGEVAALADTINNMTDTLATFADQVTNVAREVGVDGRLGGQANVPGAAGTWKDLTGNVNLLAANLTTQVRAIAEVATAVTKGDLTRSIQVEARGEVAELKDNINTMISNLRDTTESNREQDWLKTNLAKFTGMLQGQRELNTVGQMLLSRTERRWSRPIRAPSTICDSGDENTQLKLLSSYAHGGGRLAETHSTSAKVWRPVRGREEAHPAHRCAAGFHHASPPASARPRRVSIVVLPVLFEGQTKAVIELATLAAVHRRQPRLPRSAHAEPSAPSSTPSRRRCAPRACSRSRSSSPSSCNPARANCSRPTRSWAPRPSCSPSRTPKSSARTPRSSRPATPWRKRPPSWRLPRSTNPSSSPTCPMSCGRRSTRFSSSASSSPRTSRAIFSDKQVEFSRNINSSGSDLLNLINDILDLSKIESGTVTVEVEEIPFDRLRDNIDRNFRHVAEAKNLPFDVHFATDLPRFMDERSDKRLQQILKNLLSNAVKFTAQGHVDVRVGLRHAGMERRSPGAQQGSTRSSPSPSRIRASASRRRSSGSFSKPSSRLTPARRGRYGGTGLGLAISRELAALARRRNQARQRGRQGKHVYPLPARPIPGARELADHGFGGPPYARP